MGSHPAAVVILHPNSLVTYSLFPVK